MEKIRQIARALDHFARGVYILLNAYDVNSEERRGSLNRIYDFAERMVEINHVNTTLYDEVYSFVEKETDLDCWHISESYVIETAIKTMLNTLYEFRGCCLDEWRCDGLAGDDNE